MNVCLLRRSLAVAAGIMFSASQLSADPPSPLPIDERGISWAVHKSTDGTYEQMTFEAPLGMGVTIQKSNDLVNWSEFAEFYGFGQIITWNLFAYPENNNSGGGNGEDPPEPKDSVSLTMSILDNGGLLLGWRSLDTEEPVRHVIAGANAATEWFTQVLTASETEDRFFYIMSQGQYQGIVPENTQLGVLDTAMVADFTAHFPTLNQQVIDNAAQAQVSPPPLPADPSLNGFYRLKLEALDSDFDGMLDSVELANGNSSSFAFDSDGDGFSDGAEYDQGTSATNPNDKPIVEAMIVVGDGEEGVEKSQKRKLTIPPISSGGSPRLIMVGVQSFEYPLYTSGELCEGECPFNDLLRWRIKPSNGVAVEGEVDVNNLHNEWVQAAAKEISFLGYSPVHFIATTVVEAEQDQAVEIEIEAGATNIEDSALSSAVLVASFPIEIVRPKLDANGNEVAGELVKADELKVSKMEQSLTVTKDMGTIIGETLDIDKDIDRFYVRVTGGALFTKAYQLSLKAASQENPLPEYNDADTEIDFKVDNNDVITSSLLLTSDTVDDEYVGAVDVVADEQKDDRTHKLQLGGKFVITQLIAKDDEGQTAYNVNYRAPVKKKKKVTVNFVIINDGTVNVPAMQATIDQDIKHANERYAQIGIEIIKGSVVEKPVPEGLNLSNNQLPIEELVNLQPRLTTPAKTIIETRGTKGDLTDIHAFYVPFILLGRNPADRPEGVAINKTYQQHDNDYLFNIFMKQSDYKYAFAHEVGHLITNDRHIWSSDLIDTPNEGKAPINLMFDIVTDNNEISASKRLLQSQQTKIYTSPHVKNP